VFLGLWEQINHPGFNSIEFDGIRKQAGLNSCILTAKQWIESTGAIGIQSKAGRSGGTFAHLDIALEFASWISVEFKLYRIQEVLRLKETGRQTLGWDIRPNLAKLNERIHTDAIQTHLIPQELGKAQTNLVYASEADVLNTALSGQTGVQWRCTNPSQKGQHSRSSHQCPIGLPFQPREPQRLVHQPRPEPARTSLTPQSDRHSADETARHR
jgi:hypothetical protein